MQSRSGRSQKIRHNYMKIYGLTAALCVVVALAIAITSTQLGLIAGKTEPAVTPSPSPSLSIPENTPTPSEPASPSVSETPSESTSDPTIERKPMTAADLVATNPLLIVNGEHPFDPTNAKNLVNMYSAADKSNSQNRLKFNGINAFLNREAFEALEQLQFTVGNANEGFCFLLYQCHVSSADDKGKICSYCSDGELADVSHSLHATGYVVDMRYDKNGAGYQIYDGAVKNTATKTLLANCGKFGWIQCYGAQNLTAAGKEEIDQRTFRYVGVPHALYIMENGLTFDGYMSALKETNYMKPLQIADTDSQTLYKVYFVGAEEAMDPAKGVRVPAGSNYSIQGNGVDGFIVTLTEKAA